MEKYYYIVELKKEVVGNIMTNTILIILVSLGIKTINESNQPKYYEVTYIDGRIENVMVDKNSDYMCPGHCAVNHYHTVTMCENDCSENINELTISSAVDISNGVVFFRGEVVRSIELIDKDKK